MELPGGGEVGRLLVALSAFGGLFVLACRLRPKDAVEEPLLGGQELVPPEPLSGRPRPGGG
jgi:hypothetical protein